MSKSMCPCCGYIGLNRPAYTNLKSIPVDIKFKPPYCEYFGEASYEVCHCCGFEFGNDDNPGMGSTPVSFLVYLREWIEDGMEWFEPSEKPNGWSLDKQLKQAGILKP